MGVLLTLTTAFDVAAAWLLSRGPSTRSKITTNPIAPALMKDNSRTMSPGADQQRAMGRGPGDLEPDSGFGPEVECWQAVAFAAMAGGMGWVIR